MFHKYYFVPKIASCYLNKKEYEAVARFSKIVTKHATNNSKVPSTKTGFARNKVASVQALCRKL